MLCFGSPVRQRPLTLQTSLLLFKKASQTHCSPSLCSLLCHLARAHHHQCPALATLQNCTPLAAIWGEQSCASRLTITKAPICCLVTSSEFVPEGKCCWGFCLKSFSLLFLRGSSDGCSCSSFLSSVSIVPAEAWSRSWWLRAAYRWVKPLVPSYLVEEHHFIPLLLL